MYSTLEYKFSLLKENQIRKARPRLQGH